MQREHGGRTARDGHEGGRAADPPPPARGGAGRRLPLGRDVRRRQPCTRPIDEVRGPGLGGRRRRQLRRGSAAPSAGVGHARSRSGRRGLFALAIAIGVPGQLLEVAHQRLHLGHVRGVRGHHDELAVGGEGARQIAETALALGDVDQEARQPSGVVAGLVFPERFREQTALEVGLGILEQAPGTLLGVAARLGLGRGARLSA